MLGLDYWYMPTGTDFRHAYGAMVSPRSHRLPMLPYQAMRVVMDDGAKGMLDWDLVQA